MEQLPSLSVLRSFEAAAKHESFTRAAEELHVSQGAISRTVRDLEEQIGVKLFRPAGRGVVLTEAGRHLANNLSADLGRLRQTMRNASAAGNTMQTLSIGVLPTFGARWLAPRLVGFKASYPNVQFAMHSYTEPFDLAEHGIEIAIHFGRKEWIDGTLTELCPEDLVAVASPQLIKQHEISRASELESLPLLHLQTRQAAWPVYFDDLGLDPLVARQGAIFDQFSAMISAAIHGFGAAIVPTYLIETELAEAKLVAVGRPENSDDKYYVVTPKGIQNQNASDFRDWIISEARISMRDRKERDL